MEDKEIHRDFTEVDITEHYYQHIAKKSNPNWKPEFSLWKFKAGAGNKELFLITDEQMQLGYNKICLKPALKEEVFSCLYDISEDEYNYRKLNEIAKHFGIKTADERGVFYTSEVLRDMIRSEYANWFFKLTTPITKEELKELSEEKIQEAINLFVDGGYCVDPIMYYIFKPALIEPDPILISPRAWMPFSNHKMIFTGTKAGKTFIASRVGREDENASISNLLGFSTAKDTNQGSLHGLTKEDFFDEVQEEREEQLWGKLFSFMETGEASVAKGKKRMITSGYSAISFMGNTREDFEETNDIMKCQHLLTAFEDTINKVSRNYEAFGSRMGLIVFNPNTQRAEYKGSEGFEEAQKITTSLFKNCRKEITNVFLDEGVKVWLQKPYEEAYITELERLSAKSPMNSLKKLIKGAKDNYRHVRGHALRHAIIDQIHQILNEECSVEEILETANAHFEKCKQINLQSFSDMIGAIDERYVKENYQRMFDNEPLHIKAVICAVKQAVELKSSVKTPINFFKHELDDFFDYKVNPFKAETRSIPEIWERLEKAVQKNNTLLSNYKLRLTKIEETFGIQVYSDEVISELDMVLKDG